MTCAFAGLESSVLESVLVYPLVYEAFYRLASLFFSKFNEYYCYSVGDSLSLLMMSFSRTSAIRA